MSPERLVRIVAQMNALQPDLIAVAGDLVSEKRTATHLYTPAEVVAPLGKFSAPLGVMLVPGNHDHWSGWPALAAHPGGGIGVVERDNAADQALRGG